MKLIFLFLILHVCFYNQYIELTWQQDRIQFVKMKQKYEWLNKDLFTTVLRESRRNDLRTHLMMSLIQVESGGKNVISRMNKNLTRDYGIMQINSSNLNKNEDVRILMNPQINIAKGCAYFRFCLDIANQDKSIAIRFYNSGPNGKKHLYRNWAYVDRVFGNYIAYCNMK